MHEEELQQQILYKLAEAAWTFGRLARALRALSDYAEKKIHAETIKMIKYRTIDDLLKTNREINDEKREIIETIRFNSLECRAERLYKYITQMCQKNNLERPDSTDTMGVKGQTVKT